MATIFTKIIKGEIPSYKIGESEDYYAFLDISPLQEGHTLVVPKKETDNLFDLSDEEYTGLLLFTKKIAKAIQKTIPCQRVGMAVIGLDVPHVHIHLIPINKGNDMDFGKPKKELTKEQMQQYAELIQSNLE